MIKKLNKLQDLIKVNFKNQDLLIKSLTHKSYDKKNNYEKLEFLGDRVLGLTISKKLLDLYPDEKEGILDKKLASLVNKNKCFEVGKSLKLQNFILRGNPKKKTSLIENKIVSDCCEALIGAIYLDKGFDFAEKFILKIWKDLIKSSKITIIDSKTRLQEYSLKKYKKLPTYTLLKASGPHHKPIFKVTVKTIQSKKVTASGSSKKEAQQNAAKKLIKDLGL